MQPIQDFETSFIHALPETYTLLASANLIVHPLVSAVVLHGSRGPGGGFRPDSDIDLSLLVDPSPSENIENELQSVVATTLDQWHAVVEPDLAVIFDIHSYGLACRFVGCTRV